MQERDAIIARKYLAGQLKLALKNSAGEEGSFSPEQVDSFWGAHTGNIYSRRIYRATAGLFELTRLPRTISGNHAGESPYWQLTRHESGVVVAQITLYDNPGHIDNERRIHIVSTTDRRYIDSETAVKIAETEIGILDIKGRKIREKTNGVSLSSVFKQLGRLKP